MSTIDYEKLGVFYLGLRRDEDRVGPFLLPSADLVTHGVCVGMTGSGKTGLCLGLLEEAAIDGIPVIAIDPKGDLANIVLGFPGLSAEALEPWVDADEARRRGITTLELARLEAARQAQGLAESHQPLERIARLYATSEFQIFTPGSDAGVPMALLRSLEAPPPAVRASSEALRTRVESTVTAILGLAGVDADPVRSREHVLLATLLGAAWGAGRGYDLASLVNAVQTPPFTAIGVLDLESFYPKADRFDLVLALNQLLASPAAAALSQGVAPDIDNLLYGPTGHPRVSIISIAHLGEEQRRAVVTLLLGNLVAWMRAQTGTSSLRALLFMDEVAGYLPPVANPPTKPLFLTLFKQARAFGLGVVVATQNPVDVDYKVLSNAGTWFVGRLSTARDRSKVLEGLVAATEAAGGAAKERDYDRAIGELLPRQFLVVRARGGPPALLSTRQTLCYLRGPLSLPQIASLKRGARDVASPRGAEPAPAKSSVAGRPVLPPEITQIFVPPVGDALPLAYHPAVLGVARVRHVEKKLGLDVTTEVLLAATPTETALGADFTRSYPIDVPVAALQTSGLDGSTYLPLPAPARDDARYPIWKKAFVEHVFRAFSVPLLVCDETKSVSSPGETERDFRVRLAGETRAQRDEAIVKVRDKYRVKVERAEAKVRKAEIALEKEQGDLGDQRTKAVFDVGGSVLGAIFGTKTLSAANVGRAQRAVRGVKKAGAAAGEVERAEEAVRLARADLEALTEEITAAVSERTVALDAATVSLRSVAVTPKKANIEVVTFGLVWLPTRHRPAGQNGEPGGYEAAWLSLTR